MTKSVQYEAESQPRICLMDLGAQMPTETEANQSWAVQRPLQQKAGQCVVQVSLRSKDLHDKIKRSIKMVKCHNS